MKKKKGFTLIELLAVIVILAIIALIATPIILNVIDESREKSNINSVYNIIKAADLYYTENSLEDDKFLENDILENIKITGKKPEGGYLYINKDGEINIATVFDDNCYVKNFYEQEVTKVETEQCLPKEILKDKLSNLPTKKVNINGEIVNKVYGDKSARTSMNNYVWFSGNLWQVMEVNENDIKLITSMPITSIAYGNTSDYKSSWVKKWLEQKFYTNLQNQNLIKDTKFCLDKVTITDEEEINGYPTYDEEIIIKKVLSHNKINTCSNFINAKVGLMSYEDYVYSYDATNPNYTASNYLSGEELEWSLTAYSNNQIWSTWHYPNIEYMTVTTINQNNTHVKNYGHGVRPVISISPDILVSKGTGKNKDPYILSSEKILSKNTVVSNVKIGDFVYLDESNNPNKFNNEKVTRDVIYNTTKDKVRYRVIELNNNSIKLQRASILSNLDSNIAIISSYFVPYYYSSTCAYINNKWISDGCINHNIFDPTGGSGDYSYKESENIGFYLNNANNSFYSWYSDKTKQMIIDTDFNLVTSAHGKDYSNPDDSNSSTYPYNTNDGKISVKVGLPMWGDMYSGNDLNQNYWLMNRSAYSTTRVSRIIGTGQATPDHAGGSWYGVRPVVSIKPSTKISSGMGTMTNPYTLTN